MNSPNLASLIEFNHLNHTGPQVHCKFLFNTMNSIYEGLMNFIHHDDLSGLGNQPIEILEAQAEKTYIFKDNLKIKPTKYFTLSILSPLFCTLRFWDFSSKIICVKKNKP